LGKIFQNLFSFKI